MDFYTLVSSNSTDKIKCIQCKNFLSHFPIWINNNHKSVCGRCAGDSQKNRNDAYEAVAQFLQFPCRYKHEGCHEELFPKDMPLHEAKCFYRVTDCPTRRVTQCKWQGSHPNLLDHCLERHFELLLEEDEIEVNKCSEKEYEHFLQRDGMLLSLILKFSSRDNLLEYSINHFEIESYSCEIIIRNGDRKLCIQTRAYNHDTKQSKQISLVSLQSSSNESNFFIRVNIKRRNSTNVEQEKIDINLRMLTALRCAVCLEYALPPVYQCAKEFNVLCSDCNKNHIVACKSCKDNSIESNNITLNKIANLLTYYCKYEPDGCKFTSKSHQIKHHQKFCSYATFDCPVNNYVKCNWLGLGKDLEKHLQTSHHNMMVRLGEPLKLPCINSTTELKGNTIKRTSRFFGNPDICNCQIVNYANNLFRLIFANINQRYCWKLEIIGAGAQAFKYEIDVIDQTNNDRRLRVEQVCAPFSRNEETFADVKLYCYFEEDQVRSLILNNNIVFKLRMFR